jgi:hypothetical protein
MNACLREGCDRPISAKGFCKSHYNTYRRRLNPEAARAKEKAMRLKHHERILTGSRAWHKKNPRNLAASKAKWYSENIERESVRGHHYFICRRTRPAYAGLIFFDGWNPDKGGSFKAGAQWIIENLGKRPSKRHDLHIVDRSLGFVPGNLQWVPKEKHVQEELIHKLMLENQNLRLENERLRNPS